MPTQAPIESLELRLERINRLGNLQAEVLKGFHDKTSIGKRYIDGVLDVRIDIKLISADSGEYCAREIFEAAGRNELHDADSAATTVNRCKLPVFVWVGEFSQGFRPCGSHVRLELLNGVDLRVAESRQIGLNPSGKALLRVFGVNSIVFDRELRSRLFTPGILPRQFVDEVIQRGSQIVNDLTCDNSKIDRNFDRMIALKDDLRVEAVVPHIKLLLGDNFILARFPEFLDSRLQFLNMDIGPVDTGERAP